MKKWMMIYTAIFFCICLLPFVGMAFGEDASSKENRTLQELPQISDENGWNVDYLQELGSYFQDHFGFRSEMVTANAKVSQELFRVSTADNVIVGEEGWLYYKDSLNDYLGRDQMSDRALFNVAHSLAMMQEEVENQGCQFLFTVAPNKNSLYGEYMPYYDSVIVSNEKNLLRLPEFLEEEGVHYTDLYQMFQEKEEVLYHKRDSHWNNKGAALASQALLQQLGEESIDWETETCEIRCDFEGDLDTMLFPEAVTLEDEIYFDRNDVFAYVGEVESNFDPVITTVNPSGTGSLVMYRDSFGNAILPFLANHFEDAYFSRGVPYWLTDLEIHHADTVIVERAERFLPDMAKNPPVMQAPLSLAGAEETMVLDGAEQVMVEEMGNYWKISGFAAEEYLDTKAEIYIRFEDGSVYEAFPATMEKNGQDSDNGFIMYMEKTRMQNQDSLFEILVFADGKWTNIYQKGREIKG